MPANPQLSQNSSPSPVPQIRCRNASVKLTELIACRPSRSSSYNGIDHRVGQHSDQAAEAAHDQQVAPVQP